jgi:hypothetical protein
MAAWQANEWHRYHICTGQTIHSKIRGLDRKVHSMDSTKICRRDLLTGLAAVIATRPAEGSGGHAVSTFHADVTPPVGGPLFNAVRARSIADPLEAHGLVLTGSGKPIVLVSVDWCEIRNESYERWRNVLAEAAGTDKQRVLVSCVHQHDAPYVDAEAQRLLKANAVAEDLCDPDFAEQMLQRVASALRKSLQTPRAVTHVGAGRGKVEQVASSRRYVTESGKVSFGRTSATRDPKVRAQPVGTIDPWLRTISFWDREQAVAAISCYSTHPMTFYGQGDVSCDFPGIARRARQKETPEVAQIYFTGCAGDTVAGKFNDGDPRNRPILAGRMHDGMRAAWANTRRQPIQGIGFRSVPMRLAPRRGPGFEVEDYRRILADRTATRLARFEAALGLSWRERWDAGFAIDVPAVDFGIARIVLMPAESFVQYEIWAQEMRPDILVMTAGFGECAPGYIPTARDAAEGYNDHYSWIAFPECERTMRDSLRAALAK